MKCFISAIFYDNNIKKDVALAKQKNGKYLWSDIWGQMWLFDSVNEAENTWYKVRETLPEPFGEVAITEIYLVERKILE